MLKPLWNHQSLPTIRYYYTLSSSPTNHSKFPQTHNHILIYLDIYLWFFHGFSMVFPPWHSFLRPTPPLSRAAPTTWRCDSQSRPRRPCPAPSPRPRSWSALGGGWCAVMTTPRLHHELDITGYDTSVRYYQIISDHQILQWQEIKAYQATIFFSACSSPVVTSKAQQARLFHLNGTFVHEPWPGQGQLVPACSAYGMFIENIEIFLWPPRQSLDVTSLCKSMQISYFWWFDMVRYFCS